MSIVGNVKRLSGIRRLTTVFFFFFFFLQRTTDK